MHLPVAPSAVFWALLLAVPLPAKLRKEALTSLFIQLLSLIL